MKEKKRLNIALVRMRYAPYGGAEIFLSRFINELTARGHQCHIFATRWDKFPEDGVIFHKIHTFGPSFLRPLFFALKVRNCLKRASVDVIVSFDRTIYQDIYRAGDGCHREWLIRRIEAEDRRWKASGKNKIMLFVKRLVIFLNPRHLTILYLEKMLFLSRQLRFVVANSKRGKEEIIRHYGLPGERIYVIYNGIDPAAFDFKGKEETRRVVRKGLGVPEETVLLLFVGSGFERKGLDSLIRAMGLIKDESDVKLAVIGKGGTGRYRRLAGKFGIEDDIFFIGPAKDVSGYYLSGDIFVLPSIYEPFSNACLEAMAAGLPVVTSRINGASEIIDDGKSGSIIDNPLDPQEIAMKIAPFLERERREMAGMVARGTALKLTIERTVNEFVSLIERIRYEKES